MRRSSLSAPALEDLPVSSLLLPRGLVNGAGFDAPKGLAGKLIYELDRRILA